MLKEKILFFLCCLFSISVYGQEMFADSDFKELTRYTGRNAKQDTIYVFFSTTQNKKLQAKHTVSSTFKWEKYNPLDNTYATIGTFSNVEKSSVSVQESGCYVVTIANTVKLRCWVIIDEFSVSIKPIANDCAALLLQSLVLPELGKIYYYDLESRSGSADISTLRISYPHSGTPYINTIPSSGAISWKTTENIFPDVANPNLAWQTMLHPIIATPPPLVKSSYELTLINYFGNKTTASTPMIEAKASHAILKAKTKGIKDGVDGDWEDKLVGKAPRWLKLEHNCKNIDTVIWELYANKYDYELQNIKLPLLFSPIIQEKNTESIEVEYTYQPGVYPIKLYAKNILGCIDSLIDSVVVDSFLIDPSLIPTAFSPNDDGINDLFMMEGDESKFSSVWYLKIIIFNRSGQIMYEYEGKEGRINFAWNGKYPNSDTFCPTGVYYYRIEARGWDRHRHDKREDIRGYVHLFRGT